MSSSTRRLSPLALTAIAALVVCLLAVIACVSYIKRDTFHAVLRSTHSASAESIGHDVTVSGKKVPNDLHARLADDKTEALPLTPEIRKVVKPLTPLLDIGPSGLLLDPITISFPVSYRVTKVNVDTVTVLTNPTHKPDGWQRLPFTVSPDGTRVMVVVDHLSPFQVFTTTVGELTRIITEGLVDNTVTSGAFSEAKQPKCPDKATAESDGYSIKASYKTADTLFYCYGYESKAKDRIVKITNNQRYPLELMISKMALLDTNVQSMSFIEIYRQHHHAIIMPRETLTLQVNSLKRGEKASVNLSLSNWALGLGTVDTVYGVLLALYTKGKVTDAKKVAEVTSLVQDCFKNFDGESFKVGKVIVGCFGERMLKEMFGVVGGLLLAPAILALSVSNNTRALANAFADRTKDRDKYGITVSREKENQFADFVGKWRREGGAMRVNTDGTGEWVSALDAVSGPCYNFMIEGRGYCQIHVSIALKSVKNENTVTGQYTKVYITDPGGDLLRDNVLEKKLLKPGEKFTLKLNKRKYWIDWVDGDHDTVKLCDVSHISERDATHYCNL